MKVLSDILHKAGILKENAEAYSSGGYSVFVRNSTTQRVETVPSSSLVPDQSGNSGKYLTTNGTSLSWGSISTIGGTGSSGQVTFWTGSNSISGNNIFFWDNSNSRLGVGTNSPSSGITSYSTSAATQFKSAGVAPAITFSDTLVSSTYASVLGLATGSNQFITGTTAGDVAIANQSTVAGAIVFGTGTSERFRMSSLGNLLIGTSTDSGFKLDVQGTGRFTGKVTITSNGVDVIGNSLFQNNLTAYGDIATSSNFSGVHLSASGKVVTNNSITTKLLNSTNTAFISYGVSYNTNTVSPASGNNYSGYGYIVNGTSSIGLSFFTNNGPDTSTVFGSESMRLTGSGNLLLGTLTDYASSQLTINSTTKGFLPPRMTTTQKNSIASPAAGLVVYDTTLNKLCVYTTAWETITSV